MRQWKRALAGAALAAIGIVFAPVVAGIFVGYDADLLALTSHGMRLYSISFLLSGFNIFGSAFFTALGNGLISALISFFRTLLFQVGAVLLLVVFLPDLIRWMKSDDSEKKKKEIPPES